MDDIAAVERAFGAVLAREPALQALVSGPLRRSGMVQAHAGESDAALLIGAWREAAIGMNRIIDVYGLGQPPLYPTIDAVSHDPRRRRTAVWSS